MRAQSSSGSPFFRFVDALFRFLCSLKLAVGVMLTLALGMTVATVLESLYDTATGQYWVYRAAWFHFALFMLGVNIFCVAMSRLPWKRRHGPFLMAHLGILLLLVGSWVTYRFGLDGTMRLSEGQSSSAVEINLPELVLLDGSTVRRVPIRWTPPHARFAQVEIPEYGLRVDRMIAFADAAVSFVPAEASDPTAQLALQVQVAGGPMRIRQDYWLWAGDPSWRRLQAGPSVLRLIMPGEKPEKEEAPASIGEQAQAAGAEGGPGPRHLAMLGPEIRFFPQADGGLKWWARSSAGQIRQGSFAASQVQGAVIEPGWKGGVTLAIKQTIPRAASRVSYEPARIQYGPQAPPSAIHIVAGKGGEGSEVWLGMGDRATLESGGKPVGIAYQNRRQVLPFALHLERFSIDYYQGSRDPKSYSSKVSVRARDGEQARQTVEISMNEPLEHGGVTFYQASYEPGEPRPVVSIFSVNQDPGRHLKYWGSLLIVLGSIWLFWVKTRQARARARQAPLPVPG